MPQPLVSILIPCFNAEQYIGVAVESALAQDYPNVEIIVIDDGSTDDSLTEILKFESKRGFRFETGPNRGGNAARNRALALAKGEFVQFLDADDRLNPAKIRRSIERFSPTTDIAFSDCVEQTGDVQRAARFQPPGEQKLAYFISNSVPICAPLLRADPIRRAGGFDERLRCCQEYELFLRMARTIWRDVEHIGEPLCTILKVPNSVSSNEARIYSKKAEILAATMNEVCPGTSAFDPVRLAIATELLVCGRHLVRHGLLDRANMAFTVAQQAAPEVKYPARWPMRLLSGLVGPVRAEQLRCHLIKPVSRHSA